MAKRRLPLITDARPAADTPEEGGVAAWAGVALLCTLLAWLPLAGLASFAAGAAGQVSGRLLGGGSDSVAVGALIALQTGALFFSAWAGAFVVGRFGGAAPARSAYLGVGGLLAAVLVGSAVHGAVGVGDDGGGLARSLAAGGAAACLLAPVAALAVRHGFRVGRRAGDPPPPGATA